MADHGLLEPGSARAAGATDDEAVLAAMLRVEVAWLRALGSVGAVPEEYGDLLGKVAAEWSPDPATLSADAESAGNPVVPLVAGLRAAVRATGEEAAARAVHRGLTSQDVVDTALVLIARDALTRVLADLGATARELAGLARTHRASVMAGRTLTQHAVPVTFGLKAAQWLAGVLDAADRVDAVLDDLPVQCGGAAGTLALVGELAADPVATARAFADELRLTWPGAPWHTVRTPITRVADALVGTCDALGVLASDVTLLGRPEIGEVREGVVGDRGGSSTMPHKRNPVLGVLVRSAALQAPLLGAQVHTSAAQQVDERADGAWHAEWPAFRRLLTVTLTAASQAAELAAGLEVDADRMAERARAAATDLLAERAGTATTRTDEAGGDPTSYLGATDTLIDAILDRFDRATQEGPLHA